MINKGDRYIAVFPYVDRPQVGTLLRVVKDGLTPGDPGLTGYEGNRHFNVEVVDVPTQTESKIRIHIPAGIEYEIVND